MKRKWTDRHYHVQDNAHVELKYVKMYCNTNQLPELSFSGLHSKPHGSRGLSKHSPFRSDTILGIGVCAILCIPFDCVAFTSMLDKPWISGIQPEKQERCQTVTKCTYWPLLGYFNNWNIIQLSQK